MTEKFPEIMSPQIGMKSPNENLTFHEGLFSIKWKGYEFELNGKIVFKWLPTLETLVYLKDFNQTLYQSFETDFTIEINSITPKFNGKGIITRIHGIEEYNLICLIAPPVEFGDKSTFFDYVRFEIANLRDIEGTPVMSENIGLKNRILLNDDNSIITIDKYSTYFFLNQKLQENGGYQLLYTGKLELKSGKSISYEATQHKLESLTFFLSFVNGRQVSPLFRYGIVQNEVIWKSATPYHNDRFSYVHSWVTFGPNNGLAELWANFSELYQNNNDQECVKTVINWYLIANQNKALIEGSIALIQNALELLFHWLISERFNFVTSFDADNMSATSKIGFLLSHFNISPIIPPEFRGLDKYCKKNNIINGPESFTRIRNCIVHPNIKKRNTLKELENNSKVEALHLGLWYVELILLKHLKFKGEYENRCKKIKGLNPYEEIK